jgi:hypothetical protein
MLPASSEMRGRYGQISAVEARVSTLRQRRNFDRALAPEPRATAADRVGEKGTPLRHAVILSGVLRFFLRAVFARRGTQSKDLSSM